MQNFTTRPIMALILRDGLSLSAGTEYLKAADYEHLLDMARAQEEAEKQLDSIRAQAREEGLRLGREDAQKELLGTVEQMKNSMQEWVSQTDNKLVSLVNTCVQDVVKNVDYVDIIRESVQKGLKSIQVATQVVAKTNTNNVELVRHTIKELAPTMDITVIADDSLEQTDCILQSPVGNVDLRLKTQLSAISSMLGVK